MELSHFAEISLNNASKSPHSGLGSDRYLDRLRVSAAWNLGSDGGF